MSKYDQRQFSAHQLEAISVTERVCSAVSVVASCIIIATFIGSKSFRRPINRLVFYASFGNIMANVGTLISQSGINNGPNSALCQFQGFVIQWFMPADSLWALSMACNVYLALFHHYNTEHLRPLEWKYFLFCYGLPFIPAFVFFFIQNEDNGKVYGLAIQWCWISLQWDYLQVALFYGPVWFVIFLTFSIYARVGVFIFQQRRRLQKYVHTDSTLEAPLPTPGSTNTSNTEATEPQAHRYPVLEYPETTAAEPNYSSHELWNTLSRQQPNMSEMSPEAVAVWAYSKYALLFFIALLITWVPSSVNRIYALAMSDEYLFGLTYASSFVLPLQGFWNTVIYITVSWRSMKKLPHEISHLDVHSMHPTLLAGKVQRRVSDTRFLHMGFLRKVKGKLGY